MEGVDARRVLVVDDDEQVRECIARTLEREDFTVDTAEDGFAAIQKIRTNDYHAILLDVVMPRVDGFGVIHYIQERAPRLLSSVIILTGASVPQLYVQPVRRIVSKPFDLDEVIRLIRDCCGAQSA